MGLKQNIFRNLSNILGWRTNRHIIVFESDDWGSIRMPSVETFKSLQIKGVDVSFGDTLRYNKYDSLETSSDLELLFEVLSSVKDKNGNPCVFTPISLVANPDFEKIKNNGFQEYFYEPFTETLKRYPGCENTYSLWKEGIKENLFLPQFHGREHLNVLVWMRALKMNDPHTLMAFDHNMWSVKNISSSKVSYQAAFDLENPSEIDQQKEVILSGLKLFEKIFGYRATLFVPPNGPYNENLKETSLAGGIRFLSSAKIHKEPQGNGRFKKKLHYIGQKNNLGQLYLTRNCFFEPSMDGKEWVQSCLKDIEISFSWNKPAIINSHRVNYIGALEKGNRDKGLIQLKKLIKSILGKWPYVEFMTSNQLGDLILLTKNEY